MSGRGEIHAIDRPGGTGAGAVGRTELFLAFLSMGLSGFGGTLPWARVILVERRRWISARDFNDLLSLGQILPGPNIVNVSIFFGFRCHGVIGSLLAFSGLMAMPMLIVLGLVTLYTALGELPAVQAAFRGLGPAGAGFIVAMAIRMLMETQDKIRSYPIAACVLVAMVVFQVPLIWVILLAVPASLALTWATGR